MTIWSFWASMVSSMSQLKYNFSYLIFKHAASVVSEKGERKIPGFAQEIQTELTVAVVHVY